MTNQNDHDQEPGLREKIANQIQADTLLPRKELPAEELQKLQSAATRLDQMLNTTENANRQALQTAAARLDQLLADLSTGKDVTPTLKRRQNRQPTRD